jgi:hypothetical protein
VVAAPPFQQNLVSPGAGSPKLALLQPTELVNDLTTDLVAVPYLIFCVPLNVQVPYSCAHCVQVVVRTRSIVASGVSLVETPSMVGAGAPLVDALSSALMPVPVLPPPHAAKIAADKQAKTNERGKE